MITHLDLFAGIGGFSLAADWVWGRENVRHVFCEIEKFPQQILKHHWPDSLLIEDIKEMNGEEVVAYPDSKRGRAGCREVQGTDGKIPERDNHAEFSDTGCRGCAVSPYDRPTLVILTGGFPCQPYSVAGKQLGEEDDRALWPEMLRVISEARPDYVVGENVGGFVNMGLDNCLSDLEGEGYDCQPLVIPACAVNAVHRRDRVWILCHARHDATPPTEVRESNGTGTDCDSTRTDETGEPSRPSTEPEDVANTLCQGRFGGCSGGDRNSRRVEGGEQAGCESRSTTSRCGKNSRRSTQPRLGNLDDGVPSWLAERIRQNGIEPDIPRVATGVENRVAKLKALGNAVIPTIPAIIFQAIKDIEEAS